MHKDRLLNSNLAVSWTRTNLAHRLEAADWRLNLNTSKCKAFKITLKKNFIQSSYSINGTSLENVTKMRDLGVVLDRKLTFSDHIECITKKGNRALGLLIRTFQSASPRSNWTHQQFWQRTMLTYDQSWSTVPSSGAALPDPTSFALREFNTSFSCGSPCTRGRTARLWSIAAYCLCTTCNTCMRGVRRAISCSCVSFLGVLSHPLIF